MSEDTQPFFSCPHCKSRLEVTLDLEGNPAVWAAPSATFTQIPLQGGGVYNQFVNASFSPCYTYHIYKCIKCGYLEMRDYEEARDAGA